MRFRFTLNSTEYGALVLEEEPDGWKDIEIVFKRSLTYHGIFNEAMAQLEFTCRAGKEYIDKAYEELGVDAVINITIQISCATGTGSVESPDYSIDYSDDYGSMAQGTGAPIFETLYEGVIDLSRYKRSRNFALVNLIPSDFTQTVINRFETVVEITRNEDLDGNALTPIPDFPSEITLHSKGLLLQTDFMGTDIQEDYVPVPLSDNIFINIPFFVVKDEISGARSAESPYIRSSQFNTVGLLTPLYVNNTGSDIVISQEYTINITVRFVVPVNDSLTISLVFIHNSAGNPSNISQGEDRVILQQIPADDYFSNTLNEISFNVTGSYTSTINNGRMENLYIAMPSMLQDASNPQLLSVGIIINELEINFENISVTNSSSASLFKIHETGSAIAQRITGLNDPFRSNLLGRKNTALHQYSGNGCMSFAGFLNGGHIRGFGVDKFPLFMSMHDYFKTIDSIADCGMSIYKEDGSYYLQIDPKSEFYSTDVVLQCPKANIEISVAPEFYTSDITIGYEKWETENVNGLDESNTKRQYNTGVKAIESRKNFLSPCVASMYSLELTRRKGVSTVDTDYDKDNFIVCTARGTDGSGNPNQMNIAEKDEHFDDVTNLIRPDTAYNLRISPARNLLRHIRSISGSIYKYAGRAIKFVYGEGNYVMESNMSSEACDGNYNNQQFSEGQDVAWDSPNVNGTPIWIPEYIEFDYPLRFSQYLSLKNNPFGCIEVSESETDFIKGFIIELRYKPVIGMTSFKLLRKYE
jgi:hypothetical protein